MFDVLLIGASAMGVAAILSGPYLLQSFRHRRRLHHRLEAVRRLRP